MSGRHRKPLEILNGPKFARVCAPMVRYSKLAFRTLVRKYSVDLAYTPMIVSECFIRSQKARDAEFITNKGDRPLIVQFAANNGADLASAAELIFPYADGIDLNCGCPQRWALAERYGAHLINEPELVKDMILQTRNRISDPEFTVSMKIRIHDNIRQTVDFCQKIEAAGLSYIAVHGRTAKQRGESVNYEAIGIIKQSVQIPVIANGDINSYDDAARVASLTGANGVMSAQGLLNNPAMLAGALHTPQQCIEDWLDISLALGTPFTCFHHHLMFMLEKVIPRSERRIFNVLSSASSILDYLEQFYDLNFHSAIRCSEPR